MLLHEIVAIVWSHAVENGYIRVRPGRPDEHEDLSSSASQQSATTTTTTTTSSQHSQSKNHFDKSSLYLYTFTHINSQNAVHHHHPRSRHRRPRCSQHQQARRVHLRAVRLQPRRSLHPAVRHHRQLGRKSFPPLPSTDLSASQLTITPPVHRCLPRRRLLRLRRHQRPALLLRPQQGQARCSSVLREPRHVQLHGRRQGHRRLQLAAPARLQRGLPS